jgi:hypothetical protein
MPIFRSSSSLRPHFTNFGKPRALANLKFQCRIRFEVPARNRGKLHRNVKSPALVPHDFAVRVCAVVLRAANSLTESNPPCFARTPDAARVHRIPSRVRDDRDTPLVWDETAADMQVIWGKTERKYFSLWEWTAANTPNLARRADDVRA